MNYSKSVEQKFPVAYWKCIRYILTTLTTNWTHSNRSTIDCSTWWVHDVPGVQPPKWNGAAGLNYRLLGQYFTIVEQSHVLPQADNSSASCGWVIYSAIMGQMVARERRIFIPCVHLGSIIYKTFNLPNPTGTCRRKKLTSNYCN